jgi:hypothetical protein
MNYPTLITDKSQMLLSRLNLDAILKYAKRPSYGEIEQQLDLRERRAEGPQTSKKALSPSLITLDGCNLEQWFGFFRDKYPWVDAQPRATRRKWNTAMVLGEFLHAAWQGALVDSGVLTVDKVELRPTIHQHQLLQDFGYSAYMRLDGLLSENEGLEIKGVAAKEFYAGNVEKLKPDQAMQYMFFYNLDRIHYVAVDRDAPNWFASSAVKEFVLERDDDRIEQLLEKAVVLKRHIESQDRPTPNPPSAFYCTNLCGNSQDCPLYRRKAG